MTRRVAEVFSMTLPTLCVLMLPLIVPMLFGSPVPYEWNDPAARQADDLIGGKSAYLNAPFFVVA